MSRYQGSTRVWDTHRQEKKRRIASVQGQVQGKLIPTVDIVAVLEKLLMPGDRVVLEGNNQKQADFLSRSLAEIDAAKIHHLHMIMPSVGRAEHLDIFEKGIARKLDFAFSGPQSLRISQLLEDGQLEIGAIHTYIELYSRLYVDLVPKVALVAAFKADRHGNLYTGPSTEDTPALVEATAFKDGIVIAQVNELVDDGTDLPTYDTDSLLATLLFHLPALLPMYGFQARLTGTSIFCYQCCHKYLDCHNFPHIIYSESDRLK